MSGRIRREKDCVARMIEIYCRDMHGGGSSRGGPTGSGPAGLCEGCRELLDYANVRIDRCVFGAKKSTCAKCSIHCYNKQMRARIKEVMRHSGPQMAYRHPWLSLMHFLDGFKKTPGRNNQDK